jgi:hypothetical protein
VVVTGTFVVAGDSSLVEPVHQSHYPFKWSYCRNRGTSLGPNCDHGCVDRRRLAHRDGYVKWLSPLPRAYGFQGYWLSLPSHPQDQGGESWCPFNVYTLCKRTVYYAKSFHKDVENTQDFSTTLLQTNGEVPTPHVAHGAVPTGIGTTLLIFGGKMNLSDQNVLNQC